MNTTPSNKPATKRGKNKTTPHQADVTSEPLSKTEREQLDQKGITVHTNTDPSKGPVYHGRLTSGERMGVLGLGEGDASRIGDTRGRNDGYPKKATGSGNKVPDVNA